jgi:hypothetical protein
MAALFLASEDNVMLLLQQPLVYSTRQPQQQQQQQSEVALKKSVSGMGGGGAVRQQAERPGKKRGPAHNCSCGARGAAVALDAPPGPVATRWGKGSTSHVHQDPASTDSHRRIVYADIRLRSSQCKPCNSPGFDPAASSDAVESDGLQMKQC